MLATGLIVGLLWAVWHVPIFAGIASRGVPPALNVAVVAAALVANWSKATVVPQMGHGLT